MTTIKLPVHTTFAEMLTPGIGVFALFLSDAIGCKLGRFVFGAPEDASSKAYILGMVIGLFYFLLAKRQLVKRKYFDEKNIANQIPTWVFLSTIISSFLLCEFFKVFRF